MHHKTRRPAHCTPGSFTDARQLGERLRASRERLAASELATSGQAWRLWGACADATFGYAREADKIYLTTLASMAGVHRTKAGPLLRRFDELGVFGWHAAPRGSHGISELQLPHVAPTVHDERHVAPTVHERSSCSAHGSLQSNDSMTVEFNAQHSSIGTGEHRSSAIGASDSLDGLASGVAPHSFEAGAPEQTRPELCRIHGEALFDGRCVACDLDAMHRSYERGGA